MKEKNTDQATLAEPIPKGFHTVTPFLIVKDTVKLLDFIKKAFNGETTYLLKHDSGKVMHASAKIGDSMILASDADERLAPLTSMLYLYVEDVDDTYQRAIAAGGESLREPTNEFYGDRSAGVKDPWGNNWWIATHFEDVNDVEMEKRVKEFDKRSQQ